MIGACVVEIGDVGAIVISSMACVRCLSALAEITACKICVRRCKMKTNTERKAMNANGLKISHVSIFRKLGNTASPFAN